jgi:hypothetical protein
VVTVERYEVEIECITNGKESWVRIKKVNDPFDTHLCYEIARRLFGLLKVGEKKRLVLTAKETK